MENDPDLMAFNRWRAVQPDAEQSGLVITADDHAAKTCSVWWAGPETDFLDRMRAEARARGITLLLNHAPYSGQELQQAVDLIFGGTERLGQLGFALQSIWGPRPEFLGLTVKGAVLRDEETEQLPPDLVASVRGELAGLLQDSHVRPDDVRIEYGMVTLRSSRSGALQAALIRSSSADGPLPVRLPVGLRPRPAEFTAADGSHGAAKVLGVPTALDPVRGTRARLRGSGL
jgi:hypothetical protein